MTKSLDPPDFEQCQTMVHNGCGPFSMCGISRYDRCSHPPKYIIHEIKPGEDGLRGSMSLCTFHKDKFLIEMKDKIINYKFTQIL